MGVVDTNKSTSGAHLGWVDKPRKGISLRDPIDSSFALAKLGEPKRVHLQVLSSTASYSHPRPLEL